MGADRTDRVSFTAGDEVPSFAEFIRRVRAGDERAAAEFVERTSRQSAAPCGSGSATRGSAA